jgi:hypothetical protein
MKPFKHLTGMAVFMGSLAVAVATWAFLASGSTHGVSASAAIAGGGSRQPLRS